MEFLVKLMGFPAKVKLWLFGAGGVLTLLAALKLYIFKEKRVAAKEAVKEFTEEVTKKDAEVRKNAKKAVAKETRETDGLSDGAVADRLRRRTSDWERL